MSNVIIVGSGPAGISASLYLARSGADTTIISKGIGALAKAHLIENYYGVDHPLTGEELYKNGITQAKNLGVNFIEDEVISIGFENKLTVTTSLSKYEADAIILATGTSRNTPKIEGISDFEGKGISYCAVCDGFFHRGKDVAVLGEGQYALHEATNLLPIANSVTVLTDGLESTTKFPENINVVKTKVSKLIGENSLQEIVLEDGSSISVSGLFIAKGTAGSGDLAKKLGAMTSGSKIIVNEEMATNIPGLFAAGDCTGGMLQVAKAVYEGAQAGTSAFKFIRNK